MKTIINNITKKYFDGERFVAELSEECIMDQDTAEEIITPLIRDGYDVQLVDVEEPKVDNSKVCYIYTDGACSGNNQKDMSKRFGGYAYILKYNGKIKEFSAGESGTSNNRMELMAVIAALESTNVTFTGRYVLCTDSKYVKEAITEGWLSSWASNGWRTAGRKAVKNDDLWKRLLTIISSKTIEWQWTEGHVGHPENERCDTLAQAEAQKLKVAA